MKSKLLLVFFIALCFQSLSQNLIHFGIINTVSNHELTVSQEVKRYNNDSLLYSIKINNDTPSANSHKLLITLCSDWYPYQCINYAFDFDDCIKNFYLNTNEMNDGIIVKSVLVISNNTRSTYINYNTPVPPVLKKPIQKQNLGTQPHGCISLDFFYPPYTPIKDVIKKF